MSRWLDCACLQEGFVVCVSPADAQGMAQHSPTAKDHRIIEV